MGKNSPRVHHTRLEARICNELKLVTLHDSHLPNRRGKPKIQISMRQVLNIISINSIQHLEIQ